MYLLTRSYDILLENPIADAEYRHLQRQKVTAASARWRRRALIGAVLVGLGWYITDWMVESGFFTVLPGLRDVYPIVILTVIMGLMHFTLSIRTLSMASETFVREKRQNTWETLALTSLDSRRLVWGKWWGVIRVVWRDYAILAIVRAFTVIAIGIWVTTRPSIALFPLENDPLDNALWGILLAFVMTMGFTLMNMLFTTAAGVLGSLISRQHSPSISTGQATRLMILIIPILLFLVPLAFLLPASVDAPQFQTALFFGGMQLNLIDNGMLVMSLLANPYDAFDGLYLLSGLTGILTYVILTVLTMRFAQWMATRQGAGQNA